MKSMNPRPFYVTAMAWLLIVGDLYMIAYTTINLMNPAIGAAIRAFLTQSPVPISVRFSIAYSNYCIQVLCGIAMLKGRNWGRWLYLIWTCLMFSIGIVGYPMTLPRTLIAISIDIGIFSILFLPKSNHYFRGREKGSNYKGDKSTDGKGDISDFPEGKAEE